MGKKFADVSATLNRLRASGIPRSFDSYVSNLEVNSTAEQMKENLMLHNQRVILCDIVRSSRFSDVRSVAAHIILDAWDKDNAFNPEFWPSEYIVCPWKRPRRRKDSWSAWDDDDERCTKNSFGLCND